MVFILVTSSVHNVTKMVILEDKAKYADTFYSIPGLSLNPIARNTKIIVQNLLSKDLKDKADFVVWNDVLNNSISKHDWNNYCAISIPDLISLLKTLQKNSVFCQRNCMCDNF